MPDPRTRCLLIISCEAGKDRVEKRKFTRHSFFLKDLLDELDGDIAVNEPFDEDASRVQQQEVYLGPNPIADVRSLKWDNFSSKREGSLEDLFG
jgi:hypothetical protein